MRNNCNLSNATKNRFANKPKGIYTVTIHCINSENTKDIIYENKSFKEIESLEKYRKINLSDKKNKNVGKPTFFLSKKIFL